MQLFQPKLIYDCLRTTSFDWIYVLGSKNGCEISWHAGKLLAFQEGYFPMLVNEREYTFLIYSIVL
jgi:hypothetical protein